MIWMFWDKTFTGTLLPQMMPRFPVKGFRASLSPEIKGLGFRDWREGLQEKLGILVTIHADDRLDTLLL